MKLFLLRSENYEGVDIYGLYSSKEKAIESLPYHRDRLSEDDIEEIEVDPPNTGERYEPFFYAYAFTDGGLHVGETPSRLTESEAKERTPSYFWEGGYYREGGYKRGGVSAYARSKDEAIAKAKEFLPSIHPVWQVGRYVEGIGRCEVRHAHPSCVFPWERLPDNKGYAVHEDLETARQILVEYESTGRILPGLVLPPNPAKP